jgi:hypothetical protein
MNWGNSAIMVVDDVWGQREAVIVASDCCTRSRVMGATKEARIRIEVVGKHTQSRLEQQWPRSIVRKTVHQLLVTRKHRHKSIIEAFRESLH